MIITDLLEFVSSTQVRGLFYILLFNRVKFILNPTSLLEKADTNVGGRTNINYISGKNQLEVINDPNRIKMCSQFLQSFDKGNFLNGLAENIQFAGCFDNKLFK